MNPGIRAAALCLVFLLLLTGADCSFVARSGSTSDNDEQQSTGTVRLVVTDGRFVDSPVEGLGYSSGTVTGFTGPDGEFSYEAGRSVRFFIGDIILGEAVPDEGLVTPLDLVEEGSLDSTAVINIARLLQSLDVQPGDDRLTLPARLQTEALASNARIAAEVTALDFSSDAAFVNQASQLVATLTSGYPFSAVLVDADTAREHLRRSLAQLEEARAGP